ncbi:3-hydroxyacyl-CoA dehydrogenase family protein [Paenibacillus arenosi]|uniref:3-hydroxyacyl-CoA dehydrogenase family protein n=1 Tax=Paenibacillus arenosi TaxID=2774142 RepID=A0ABR9AS34_9BACL|nr:3-hydroxyacyl-CoA dehydrogenase family protein [Paenibacillus arenosi]MBD8496933.1 3-hydroxyacyl-CoA dehydrogenase family protein [Paenibacillus arenosi]
MGTALKIGVIGAGTMGTCITADLLFHELPCVLVDISEKALADARAEIEKVLRFAVVINKDLPKVNVAEVMEKVRFTTDIRDVSDCSYMIENVPEHWETKEQVYKQMDHIFAGEMYYAANTSCLSITKLGGVTSRPENVIGVHFMNPSYLKSTVEVIKGHHTSDTCIEQTVSVLKKLNKETIIVNDYPGFVSNRISHLFMNEAAFVVQDQVADAAQVDAIFKKCYGHKMGPLETADLIGLDTVVHSLDVLYQSYQDPKYRCCPLLRKMVDANLLGKKSGRGFFTYKK